VIRVLHSVSNMDRGGIETMLMNYYRHMDRDVIQFDFLCNKTKPGAYDDEIRSLGGKIYHTPGFNPFRYGEYIQLLKRIKEENKCEIIHVHNGAMGAYALNAANIAKVPVRIYHAHGAAIEKNKKWIVKMICKATIPFNLTHRFTCGIAAARCYYGEKAVLKQEYTLIPNAVAIDRFLHNKETRKVLRRKYGLEDKHLLGHVGRFSVQKNHMFLLEILTAVKQYDPKAYLVLLGEGELLKQIKERACTMGLQDDILFAGNVANVNEWYQAFDVMVMPSLWEGLPVVGVEAQAADLPCIFSDSITREIGILDTAKFISLDAPVGEWADAVQRAMEYRERKNVREAIAARGYDIEVEAKKLQEAYLELARAAK